MLLEKILKTLDYEVISGEINKEIKKITKIKELLKEFRAWATLVIAICGLLFSIG